MLNMDGNMQNIRLRNHKWFIYLQQYSNKTHNQFTFKCFKVYLKVTNTICWFFWQTL